MGEHKNSRLWNWIAWATSIIVIGMTLIMLGLDAGTLRSERPAG